MKLSTTLVLSDMDGTLLNTKKEISKENQQAIYDFIDKDGLFGVATGRSWENIQWFFEDFRPNAPCILCNGSILFDPVEEEIIECRCMDDEALARIVNFVKEEYPDTIILANTPTDAWVIYSGENMQEEAIKAFFPYQFGNLENVKGKCVKLLCYDKNLKCYNRLSKEEGKTVTKGLKMVCSGGDYMEFLPDKVSKGSMLHSLKTYLKRKGTSSYKVYALGDYENDIELLQNADVGVAPDNALEAAKEAADLVSVSNNQHVVAELIDSLLKKKEF